MLHLEVLLIKVYLEEYLRETWTESMENPSRRKLTSSELVVDNGVQKKLSPKMLWARTQTERADPGAPLQPWNAHQAASCRPSDSIWLQSWWWKCETSSYSLKGTVFLEQTCNYFKKIDLRGNRLKECGPLIAEVLQQNEAIEVIHLGDNRM